jgi:nonsense-mediated mRNA decay protein 3
LCCQCGVLIDQNPLNTCLQCIQSKIDITDDLSKECLLQTCNKCDRYLQPPSTWITATLESRQLLGICLKRVKGLSKLHLVDAGFIWTEPHSKRIKVKLTVQKDVSGALLQQTCVIEFQIVNQICEDCQRVEAKDYWKCVVQVRQRSHHKKTFFYLEQLILKLNAHQKTVSIKQTAGLCFVNFFYHRLQSKLKKFVIMKKKMESIFIMLFNLTQENWLIF